MALLLIGAIDQWLEGLDDGAESRSKVQVRGWASPCDNRKTMSQPSSKWVPFSN